MKGDHPFKRKAKSSKTGGYKRGRVQIGFDDATREIITARSIANNHSFAAEVRALVAQALDRCPYCDGDESKCDFSFETEHCSEMSRQDRKKRRSIASAAVRRGRPE
jgi:hypothetical protein